MRCSPFPWIVPDPSGARLIGSINTSSRPETMSLTGAERPTARKPTQNPACFLPTGPAIPPSEARLLADSRATAKRHPATSARKQPGVGSLPPAGQDAQDQHPFDQAGSGGLDRRDGRNCNHRQSAPSVRPYRSRSGTSHPT